jgi:hypothetical protein
MIFGEDQSIKKTQQALAIKQTIAAQTAGQIDQVEGEAQTELSTDAAAQNQEAVEGVDQPVTSAENASQVESELTVSQTDGEPSQEPVQEPEATEPVDLESAMNSANILLFEDMVGETDTIRYVKKTLDQMGLQYEDVGSAKGWLKSQLLSGGPDGQGWDLIILAAERKGAVSGEYFEYLGDALNKGSSVILEVWYLDKVGLGKAAAILHRCGVEYQADWSLKGSAGTVMYPTNSDHPIMYEPNSGLSFTDVTGYWGKKYPGEYVDVGDLLRNTYRSDAEILVGTQASNQSSHGTVAVCMGGQLILQTFCSHNLTFNEMQPVWENYIYNALRTRFLGPQ